MEASPQRPRNPFVAPPCSESEHASALGICVCLGMKHMHEAVTDTVGCSMQTALKWPPQWVVRCAYKGLKQESIWNLCCTNSDTAHRAANFAVVPKRHSSCDKCKGRSNKLTHGSVMRLPAARTTHNQAHAPCTAGAYVCWSHMTLPSHLSPHTNLRALTHNAKHTFTRIAPAVPPNLLHIPASQDNLWPNTHIPRR